MPVRVDQNLTFAETADLSCSFPLSTLVAATSTLASIWSAEQLNKTLSLICKNVLFVWINHSPHFPFSPPPPSLSLPSFPPFHRYLFLCFIKLLVYWFKPVNIHNEIWLQVIQSRHMKAHVVSNVTYAMYNHVVMFFHTTRSCATKSHCANWPLFLRSYNLPIWVSQIKCHINDILIAKLDTRLKCQFNNFY